MFQLTRLVVSPRNVAHRSGAPSGSAIGTARCGEAGPFVGMPPRVRRSHWENNVATRAPAIKVPNALNVGVAHGGHSGSMGVGGDGTGDGAGGGGGCHGLHGARADDEGEVVTGVRLSW